MAIRSFNEHWTFWKTTLESTLEQAREKQSLFKPVEIPHDWLIYDTENLYEDSCGWYCRHFNMTDFSQKERMIIRFDGVYMDSTVYLNSQKVGDWKYGYSTFDMDLTDFLHQGENELMVQVRFQAPNSRWYSGAGIYRNIWIQTCPEAYLPMDGTYISTRPCKEGYILEAETEVAGRVTSESRCRYRLCRQDGTEIDLGWQQWTKDGKVGITAMVATPKLWDIDSPELYELQVELYQGQDNKPLDSQKMAVGFRTMEFIPEKGFFLNGRKVAVNGVCEHHDLGALGAAFHKSALERKFRILKEMGVNALRSSHNMPAPEWMDLADKMGFLVMDEAFDMWERTKTTYDYGRFFKEWAERDVRSWIRRDRNHPSLMMWSIGNEIYDTHADEHGQEITKRLIQYVRCHDPKENAPITIGSNYMPWENARKCADIVKLAGYNYGEKYYEEHHKEHPDWVIYGSETASIVQSRGIYHFPLSQSVLADEDEQCSALGNSTTSWGAKSLEKCITDHRDPEYVCGQFLWTGFDYIGEPTPYHTKNSYFGQIDTAGFPKDAYYVFQAEWTDVKKSPMVHLFPYWDFNPGQRIDVRACTNAPSVELFVNGKSCGIQKIDHAHGKRLLGDWQVPYEPGEIVAVAYDECGNEIARDSRHSFGDSVSLMVTPDRKMLHADKDELAFLTIQMADANGYAVENAVDYVSVDIQGTGRLLGMDNGDSTDTEPYKTNVRKLFSGRLLAVIGTTGEAGEIKVTVSATGMEPVSLTLTSALLDGETALIDSKSEPLEYQNITAEKQIDCQMDAELPAIVPVRKVELTAQDGQTFTAEKRELLVRAQIYPETATDTELIWKVVNDGGVDIGFAKIEEIQADGHLHMAKVTALGDGAFRVRCMSRGSREHVTVISSLEYRAEGLGQAFLNPYEMISAGLFTDTVGEVGNGNEKGIATARDGVSGVVFSNVDFGEYGSDTITMPVFALSSDRYDIDIWIGKPYETGSRLLDTVVYQKPSIWNTYQEETWKLSERICGVVTIAFVLKAKVHIKGFSFLRYEKAFCRLEAAKADRIYGDSFRREDGAVKDIGNNVTFEFENMNFGKEGTNQIAICGQTPLSVNTIHIHFTDKTGETVNRIVEFIGSEACEEQKFAIETLSGEGKVELIFLPGSRFDLFSIQFGRL